MEEKVCNLIKSGGGSGKLTHYRTSITGSQQTAYFNVTGKVRFLTFSTTYNGTLYVRIGTDKDILYTEDGTYDANQPAFIQNGSQISIYTGSRVILTWTVDYWSE